MNEVLRKQLESVPEDVRARILLSSNLAEGGESEESIRHLQTAVALRPNDGNTLYNAACTYGCLKMKKEALEMLKRAFASLRQINNIVLSPTSVKSIPAGFIARFLHDRLSRMGDPTRGWTLEGCGGEI